jgi:tetratricopeptide (TPR) repeat protein
VSSNLAGPDYAQAFFNRGIAYHKKGQYDKAAKDFKAAIRLKVVFAGTFLFWGTVIPDQSAPLATASRCSVRMESKR